MTIRRANRTCCCLPACCAGTLRCARDASCLSFLSGLRAAPSRMSRTAEGARRTSCRPFVFPFYRRRLS